MTWWLWLLVALGIWGVPGVMMTLTVHRFQDGLEVVAERITFFGLFFWPIVIWLIWAITISRARKMALSH